MSLTEKQISILAILAAHAGREEIDGPLTGPRIGEIHFRHVRTKSGVKEWATPILRQLEAKGLVDKLGVGEANARCWKINAAGVVAYGAAVAGSAAP